MTKLIDILNGALDAADWQTAAACITAHPVSEKLSQQSNLRLVAISMSETEPTPCDKLVIEIVSDAVAMIERGA